MEVLSLFLSIIEVLSMIQNEIEEARNKIVKPHEKRLFNPKLNW